MELTELNNPYSQRGQSRILAGYIISGIAVLFGAFIVTFYTLNPPCSQPTAYPCQASPLVPAAAVLLASGVIAIVIMAVVSWRRRLPR